MDAPWLEWQDGTGTQRVLLEHPVTLGSTPENVIQVNQPGISRSHCTISSKGAEVLVDARASQNGVRVDGQRVYEARLRPGQRFEAGGIAFAIGGRPGSADSGGAPALLWDDVHGRRTLPVSSPVTIGRTPENTIQVNAPGISRRHAVVSPAGNAVSVDATGSTNGIRIAGQRVASATVRAGESFEVGPVRFGVGAGSGRARGGGPAAWIAIAAAVAVVVLVGGALAAYLATRGGDGDGVAASLATARIDAAEGGTLQLKGGGSLHFPAGSLPEDATATVRVAELVPGEGAVEVIGQAFEFELEGGLQPSAPLTLTLPLPEGTEPDGTFLAYFEPSTNRWLAVGGRYDANRGTVSTEITHLSGYALASLDPTKVLDDLAAKMEQAANETSPRRLMATLSRFTDAGLNPVKWWEAWKDREKPCNASGGGLKVTGSTSVGLVGCIQVDQAGRPTLSIINANPYFVGITSSNNFKGYPQRGDVLAVGEERSWAAGDIDGWATLTITADATQEAAVMMFADIAVGFILDQIEVRGSAEIIYKAQLKLHACLVGKEPAKSIFSRAASGLRQNHDDAVLTAVRAWSDERFVEAVESCAKEVGFEAMTDVGALISKRLAKALENASVGSQLFTATVRVGSMLSDTLTKNTSHSVEFAHGDAAQPNFAFFCITPVAVNSEVYCNIQAARVPAESYTWTAPGSNPTSGTGQVFNPRYGAAGTFVVTAKGCKGSLCTEVRQNVVVSGGETQPNTDQDSDGDGIPNSRDACDTQAEDRDNFEDSDGCPEPGPVTDPDPDGDGIPNSRDGCDNQAEDRDNFEDSDGCPEPGPDRDGDGVPDSIDECPDARGPAHRSGCPEPLVTVPAAPSALNVSMPYDIQCVTTPCGPFPVVVEWNDNSNNETGFRVYLNGNLLHAVAANSTHFEVQNPVAGRYCFEVSAVNSAGESARAFTDCRTLDAEPELGYELTATMNKYNFLSGEGFTVCYDLSPIQPFELRVYVSTDGGAFVHNRALLDDGYGDCFDGTMGAPGGRTIRLEAWVGGSLADDVLLTAIVFGTVGGN